MSRSDEEFDNIPQCLMLNITGRIGAPEASRWLDFFEEKGRWPSVEDVYRMRYNRGDNLKTMPFMYFRKFVLQDLALSDFEKENLFLEFKNL